MRNIIVTGCNKGIGYGIIQNLASKPNNNIIMACRNIQLAQKSKQQLLIKYPTALLNIEKLDISSQESITNFIPNIKNKYHTIDVLINNAGVAAKGDQFDSNVVKFTFDTNFYGTIQLSQSILPIIKNQGKIITVASMASSMSFAKITDVKLKQRFKNQKLTKQELFQLMKEFANGVKEGNYAQKGWPKWVYGISKLGICMYCRIFAQQKEILDRGIQIYSCCPGYVNTDMTSHKGHLTIQQGAETPIYLCQLPNEINKQLQGGFFQKCKLSTATD